MKKLRLSCFLFLVILILGGCDSTQDTKNEYNDPKEVGLSPFLKSIEHLYHKNSFKPKDLLVEEYLATNPTSRNGIAQTIYTSFR